jgi:hypothetical protein
LKRRKPSRRWKTVEAERGWAVAPSDPMRRQRCRGGSGLFSSVRRRGVLWKTLGEASGRRPRGPVGGRDGNVGKGDVKHTRVLVAHSKGERLPGERSVSSVPGDRENWRRAAAKTERAATFIGFVPWLPGRAAAFWNEGRGRWRTVETSARSLGDQPSTIDGP